MEKLRLSLKKDVHLPDGPDDLEYPMVRCLIDMGVSKVDCGPGNSWLLHIDESKANVRNEILRLGKDVFNLEEVLDEAA